MSVKETLKKLAAAKDVRIGYSGKKKTMFVSGEDNKVKSFIRSRNLEGKSAYPFKFAQS